MLVFQKNIAHVLEDGCKRANIDPKRLVETVAAINRYLPDDWRLTRTRNNFRIQIVARDPGTLVGSCFRTRKDTILHIIDSFHLKHFFDCVDLSHQPTKIRGKVNKKSNPELLVPNLYFFRPCPDGFSSPLFARQYERILQKKDGSLAGDQYHRIHPLTRSGLDFEHFLWVRWSINGDVTIVETPDSAYHGKDYWRIPLLSEASGRGASEDYHALFASVVDAYGVHVVPDTQAASPRYENEHKFIIQGDEAAAAAISREIEEAVLRKAGWVVQDQCRRHSPQVDVYFDDEDLRLHRSGAIFRMRKKDATRVTLKKRFPDTKASSAGSYRRIEEEAVITAREEKALMAGHPINAFPYRLIFYIAPLCGPVRPVIVLETHRRILHLRDAKYREAELCFDRVIYQIGGKRRGPFLEIELESKGAPEEAIGALASQFQAMPHVEAVEFSKFERGLLLKKAD